MPEFSYRAARSDGTTLEGQVEGDNEATARAQLEAQGLLVFHMRRKGDRSSLALVSGRGKGNISLQDFLVFNQELLALIKAGLPILRVWDLLIERARQPAFRSVLEVVRQDIRGGASASDALARHPTYFPELYIASIRAGEQAGNLPEVLQRYILHLKLMIGLRQKMLKALAYPAVLVGASVLVILFFLVFVVPSFMEIYQDTARSLPVPTQILISLVETIQASLIPVAGTLLVLGIGLRVWCRTTTGRSVWDRMLLRIPWVGETLLKQHTIQFARTLATVLSGGTPLVEALQISRGAMSNTFLAAGLTGAVSQIREGATLGASLAKYEIVPRLALEMLAVGEETGSLEMMLRDVAEFYEGELDFRLNQLTTGIEILLLLFMGLVIGTIVVVMYLPIFQMAGSV